MTWIQEPLPLGEDRYPAEDLSTVPEGSDWYYYADDDGTMPANVDELRQAVVGHKIVKVEKGTLSREEGRYYWGPSDGLIITLDNGKQVELADSSDCCAYTELESFLLHADKIDHIITGVGTTGGFTTWHIYADLGDVLELQVGWSCGNPFYYGYGFYITVVDSEESE